jgi:hypothetical protein
MRAALPARSPVVVPQAARVRVERARREIARIFFMEFSKSGGAP